MAFLPYKRSVRVAEGIYQVIAEVCCKELKDPRLKGLQLIGAEMTDDLQLVKVYYYIDGAADVRARALKGLESAKGYLKRAISERMELRFTPDIKYYFDEGMEKAERLDQLLKGLKK